MIFARHCLYARATTSLKRNISSHKYGNTNSIEPLTCVILRNVFRITLHPAIRSRLRYRVDDDWWAIRSRRLKRVMHTSKLRARRAAKFRVASFFEKREIVTAQRGGREIFNRITQHSRMRIAHPIESASWSFLVFPSSVLVVVLLPITLLHLPPARTGRALKGPQTESSSREEPRESSSEGLARRFLIINFAFPRSSPL